MESQICWIFGTSWPCLTPSEWASWAQAVGTFLALGIAITIPAIQRWFQQTDARRAEEIASGVVAGALLQPINAVKSGATVVKAAIERGDTTMQLAAMSPAYLAQAPEFDQFRPQLHLLGTLGLQINTLISWLPIPRAFLLACSHAGDEEMPEEAMTKALRELTAIINVAEHCEKELFARLNKA